MAAYITFSTYMLQIAQVPIGTVIHLVEGEQPSLTVNELTRALDPFDIPISAEHSSSSNQDKSD